MKIATASSTRLSHSVGTPPDRQASPSERERHAPSAGRVAAALACIACVLLTMGCKSSSSASPDAGNGISLHNCSPNVASTPGGATAITSGTTYNNQICYEGTSNWYLITVPSGSTLLDVAAGYPQSMPQVDLDVKVFFKTSDTMLTQIQELIAPAMSDAGVDAIETTLHVVQAGDYYIQVADAHNTGFDAKNAYTITVGTAVDPDTHEPNDTVMMAKPSDAMPSFLAYQGDLDIFSTSVASAGDLLTLSVANPMTASSAVSYSITSSMGTVLAEGSAPAAAKPFTTDLVVAAAGTYYVTFSLPMNILPTRAPADGYTVTLGSVANPDKTPNHTIATATCPGGGTGPCSMAYSGTAETLPPQTNYITVPGQRDFYRVDVTSGAALVLQIDLSAASSTPVKYAVDILTPDPKSACKLDTDCAAIDAACSKDTDCELSHKCLAPAQYGFCPMSTVACTLCEGAGICIPPASGSGMGSCAIAQYLSAFTPSGMPMGGSTVSTAQPLFTNGTYYINVHDDQYMNVDLTNAYTLKLQMVPEPDPNDQSTTPSMRNNFYNPYPSAMSDLSPSASRAIDISSYVCGPGSDGGGANCGQSVSGFISYQTDEDWYVFDHPCPGENCGINFQFTQPGPSNAHIAFFMVNQDLSGHESFAYTGATPTTALMGPATGTFANADCTQCSFAAMTMTGSPYKYYMRITDAGQAHWDYSSTGKYSFSVTSITPGCPTACLESASMTCVCYCAATMTCPNPML